MNRILITICARGGSKGLPRKNILPINQIPLIGYTINLAKEFSKHFNSDIGLSTDDIEILEIARQFGLDSEYIRPKNLATDNIGKLETIQDLINYHEKNNSVNYDFYLDLDVSSPLRNLNDLKKAYTKFQFEKKAINLFSVSHASKNPYFNMVEIKQNGFAKIVKNGNYLTRQSAPDVFDLNASFYFYRRKFFYPKIHSVINNRSIIWEMDHICFDVDHKIDYEFMKYLIENDKLDFKF